MKKYKYEFFTTGYSNEVVVGSISQEEIKKIEDLLDENDFTTSELFQDWDILAENDLREWHEIDDKEHIYGPLKYDSTLTVVDLNTKEVVLKTEFSNLKNNKINYISHEPSENESLFYATTLEKGCAMEGILELDEPFEERKLTFETTELAIEDYEHDLVQKIFYDNKEISTDINSTDVKEFIVECYY